MFFCSAKKVITWKYLGGSLLFNRVVGLYEFRANAKTTSNNSQYLLWCYNFKNLLGYSQKQPLEILYKKAVLKDMTKWLFIEHLGRLLSLLYFSVGSKFINFSQGNSLSLSIFVAKKKSKLSFVNGLLYEIFLEMEHWHFRF